MFSTNKWYSVGNVTIINGSTTVSGQNTAWLEADIKQGDIFVINNKMYEISRVVSSTELILTKAFSDTSVENVSYAIIQRAQQVLAVNIAYKLEQLIEKWKTFTPCGGYKTILDIIIPANGWVVDETPSTDHTFICDIVNDEITSEMFPVGSSYLGSIGVSTAAGMICACETFNGYIRFYADEQPLSDIRAMVALFEKSNGHGGGGGGEDVEAGDGLAWSTDGKLAVKIGNGLKFDENRAITADPQKVFTDNDLLDEDATEQDLKRILLSENTVNPD